MFDIFSTRQSRNHTLCRIHDGYGEYLAYPFFGTLSKEQFEKFQKITLLAKENYPPILDNLFIKSSDMINSVRNLFGIQSNIQIQSSARIYWIQFKLFQACCPVKVFFLPRTFYDILTTHITESISEPLPAIKVREEMKLSRDEHFISEEVFQRLSTELAFKVNQHVLTELNLQKKGPVFSLSQIQSWALSAFQTSPWYSGIWKDILQKRDVNENFPTLLSNALHLECSTAPSSTLLYRGCRSDGDSLESSSFRIWDTGVKFHYEVHSLSYGTSLIAGGKEEHNERMCGTPWIYCLDKYRDCIAIEVPKQDKNSPFYIPRTNLQMISGGEFFHARSKITEERTQEADMLSVYPDSSFMKFQGSREELEAAWKTFHKKAFFLKKVHHSND